MGKDKLNRLADPLKRLARKAVSALPGIIRTVIGAVLNFLGKAVGFFAKNMWAFIIFISGLIAHWIYLEKSYGLVIHGHMPES